MSLGKFLFDRDVILAGLSLLVSLALLWLYLRAVRRSMLHVADIATIADATSTNTTRTQPSVPLVISRSEPPTTRSVRSTWRGPTCTAIIQLIAGFAYASGVTLAWLWLVAQSTGWQGFDWRGFFVFTMFFAWPLVVVIGVVATVTWRAIALLILTYVVLLVPAALFQMHDTAVTPAIFALNWWNINGPATLFVLAFLLRPIRAMGPIVAALVVAMAAGVFGLAVVLDASMIERVASVATTLGFRGNLGGYAVGLIVYGSAAVGAALLAYVVLRGLGRLYRAQWLSDQSLQIDAVWLTFAVLQSPKELPYAGLASFLLYKAVAAFGQKLIGSGRVGDENAPRLLLLRVFSLGARSERLFRAFALLWRYTGSVRMIAGPDLANATVEPHEFLDFLAGRLQRRFITSSATLDRRLAETQLHRDLDGRFRVSNFFCHADTWQMVLRRLARDSDVVLMDLRGFTQANQGCVFELHQLLDAVPLANALFLVDATTDQTFLSAVLTQGWANIGIDARNRLDPNPKIRLYPMPSTGARGIGRLVATLASHRQNPPATAA